MNKFYSFYNGKFKDHTHENISSVNNGAFIYEDGSYYKVIDILLRLDTGLFNANPLRIIKLPVNEEEVPKEFRLQVLLLK